MLYLYPEKNQSGERRHRIMYSGCDFREEKEEYRDKIVLPVSADIIKQPLRMIFIGLLITFCIYLADAICPDLCLILGPVLTGILIGLFYALRRWALKINYEYRSMPRPDKRDIWSGI